MFQQAGTAQLNDYFRPLSERGGSRVFFCRIAGYGETVAAFLRRYYEAARRSGVIIDGRIPNPTPDNLSYFNEMMGSGFQMDRDFLSQRLKKWLPRMTDGQRDAVVTAMYATLDDMRRAGKNDNMLRNAYMKYMCWLYYKFERIVNVLGGETLPKILYAGDVSHYELQLLTVLSRAGADIVLLETGGDQAYLTVDPQSALSRLYQAPGLGPFPAGFGVKQLQADLEREVRRQRLYGTPPSLSPCTNAWVQKAELNAALTAVQARGNDPRFFCNLFLCQYGVEDNLTYTNDLFAFYQSLQGGGRRICVVNGDPAPPGPEEIAAVKGGILKPGRPAVLQAQGEAVAAVIRGIAQEKQAPFLHCADWPPSAVTLSARGARFTAGFPGLPAQEYEIRLPGAHQVDNAVTALAALSLLPEDLRVSPEAARAGLRDAVWPGRLEWRGNLLLDGAHNPQGVRALREYAQDFLRDRRVAVLTGSMADKDVAAIAEGIAAIADAVVCVSPEHMARAVPAPELCGLYRGRTDKPVFAAEDTAQGLRQAQTLAGEAGVVLVCGSLYLVGEVRRMLESPEWDSREVETECTFCSCP